MQHIVPIARALCKKQINEVINRFHSEIYQLKRVSKELYSIYVRGPGQIYQADKTMKFPTVKFFVQPDIAAIRILSTFAELISAKDGNWSGFIFPDNFDWNKLALEKTLTIDFPIILESATFHKITFDSVIFKEQVNFSSAIFEGPVFLRSRTHFEKHVNFEQCIFRSTFDCTSHFNKSVSFGRATFFDTTIFQGVRNLTVIFGANKENSGTTVDRMFETDNKIAVPVSLENTKFHKPQLTSFQDANFSKTELLFTNFRGISFQDIIWPTSRYGQRVIYDDIHITSADRSVYLSHIENTYRNLRVTLEDNKDFLTASDFYVGEMEAARTQKPYFQRNIFSILALYKCLSRYGTSPLRAFFIFILFLVTHYILTSIITGPELTLSELTFIPSASNAVYMLQIIGGYLVNSLKILTLQNTGAFIKGGALQAVLDTCFRIIGPAQLALLALAFRVRVKRH